MHQTQSRTGPVGQIRPGRADGERTRRRIMGVAERHFADEGIDGAVLGEIATEADQANRSAVQYHFGSRQGLVDGIMLHHQADIDEQRLRDHPDPASSDLEELVRSLIEPVSAKLETRSGRYYLIMLPQVVHRRPEEDRRAPNPEPSRNLLAAIENRLDHLSPEVAGHRVAAIVTFGADALGDRARVRRRRSVTPEMGDALFTENLIQMILGALLAPPPDSPDNPESPDKKAVEAS